MDRANSELAAMQAIVSALSALPDADSRNRVLRWASEHFSAALVPSVVTSIQAAAPADDEIIEIDALDVAPMPSGTVRETGDPENLGSLFEVPRPSAPAKAERQPKSVVSTLESFVADFKKLAHDWKNAS